jgi:inner membrane protein
MASLGHIAVGMAAARAQGGGLGRMASFSALSMLPDADVIAFSLGIPYSAPFRPIPVAPIGLGILSERGLHCMAVEALMFSPLFLYALWPRRRRP